MASYREELYTSIDNLFGLLKTDPFSSPISDPTAHEVFGPGTIMPVGWVHNASAADGDATVVIDADGITVSDGSITVENPSGTVIIDGTSNMFKIVASGTMTRTQAATSSGFSSVTFPSAGLDSWNSPAFIGYITEGTSPISTANRYLASMEKPRAVDNEFYAADTSDGAVNGDFYPIIWEAHFFSNTDGSGVPQINLAVNNGQGSSVGVYGRYHILKEAAI